MGATSDKLDALCILNILIPAALYRRRPGAEKARGAHQPALHHKLNRSQALANIFG